MSECFVGDILRNTRIKANTQAQDIYEGLCSKSVYYEYEGGNKVPTKEIFDALLQRLGKSADQFEAIYSKTEYDWILLQEKIETMLQEKKFEELDNMLSSIHCKGNIQQQYIHMIKGIVLFYMDQISSSCQTLSFAYDLTANGKRYTLQECLILIELGYNFFETDIERYKEISENLYNYSIDYITDNRELVKVLPKAVLLLSAKLISENKWNVLYLRTKKAIELLRNEGEILGLKELFELQRQTCTQLYYTEEVKKITKWINCLTWIYKAYGYNICDNRILTIKKSIRTEYYLSEEYFKNYRYLLNYSQEEMSEIVSDRQLRRIESGSNLSDRTYNKFESILCHQKARITGYMNAVDFDIIELSAEIAKAGSKINLKRMNQLFDKFLLKFKGKIGPQSKQKIGSLQIYLNLFFKRTISPSDAIQQCITLIHSTQPNFQQNKIISTELNRVEVELLNLMAAAYKEMGKIDVSEQIWSSIIAHFENSKIYNHHSASALILVLENLAGMYETKDEFESSLRCCDIGIALALRCEILDTIQKFLTQKAYTLERKNAKLNLSSENKNIIQHYENGCILAQILKDDSLYSFTKQYIKKQFSECTEQGDR